MNIPDFLDFLDHASNTPRIKPHAQALYNAASRKLTANPHGNLPLWLNAIPALPQVTPSSFALYSPAVRIGTPTDTDDSTRSLIEQQLRVFHPWRKGPFDIFGIHIDTEWRSDWKWNRLVNHIQPLYNRRVLDIGCGSSYHCWRMAAHSPRSVIGIEPYIIFFMQYLALRKYLPSPPVFVLPIPVEELPDNMLAFDTVFSMGVLYHRKSPIDHLFAIRNMLRPGGQLVLETLVINGDENSLLIPEDRYAKMRNVWFIPSTLMLERWLKRSGFINVRTVDVSPTSTDEQHSTPWMRLESLPDFLLPHNPSRTIENLPAPTRAIIIAETLT